MSKNNSFWLKKEEKDLLTKKGSDLNSLLKSQKNIFVDMIAESNKLRITSNPILDDKILCKKIKSIY